MKNIKLLISLVLIFCLGVTDAFGINPNQKTRVIWGSNPDKGNGLYTRRPGSNASQGISFGLNMNYYYGDVERPGLALIKGNAAADNIGGSASIYYSYPMGDYLVLRAGIIGGLLRANNENNYDGYPRKFQNIFGEPNVMLQYYPWTKAGFYIGAGISLIGGYTKYTFSTAQTSGERFTMLPTIPVEIGYDVSLGKGFVLTFNIAAHPGFMDTSVFNLDGWPNSKDQDPAGWEFGMGDANDWADGYFSAGIILTYRWMNCKVCRIYKW